MFMIIGLLAASIYLVAIPRWAERIELDNIRKQRKQVLRCTRVNGKPVYTPYK